MLACRPSSYRCMRGCSCAVPFFDERKEIVLGKKAVEKYDIADDGSQGGAGIRIAGSVQ